jgi:hypothetical protein
MSDDSESIAPAERPRRHLWPRLALAQAILLLVAVVVALPVAFRSMGILLTDSQARTLYDFPSGQPTTETLPEATAQSESFFNIAAIELDEAQGSITLAVSGHRVCTDCPALTFNFISLDDNADVRRALPPSAQLTLQPDQAIFSQTIQLPVRGQPSQFPFDDYVLWLGLSGTITLDGRTVPLTPELLSGRAVITTQNQLRDFLMKPPVEIDPARVTAVTDPYDFFGVQELHFERPVHQEILAVLLIALIAVSAIIAVAMRTMTDLIVGIGSLILGIWGVRSVLVPSSVAVVTSIDLALSVIILFVLLGLLVRSAHHFHTQSELPAIQIRRRQRRHAPPATGAHDAAPEHPDDPT